MTHHSNNNGFTIWFTGLSGAGKTTLSHAVHEALRDRGVLNVEILDGDIIRKIELELPEPAFSKRKGNSGDTIHNSGR